MPLPLKAFGLSGFASAALIEGGVAGVEVLGIEVILGDAEGIGEALIMHDLALAQESDDVVDVGIVREAKDIVVGGSCLLLCYYHVFATKSCLAKVRKILMFQGISALLKLTIFQKFQ